MFTDSTSHTIPLEHYSGNNHNGRRKFTLEAVFPIVMIVVGIIGIALLFSN